MYYDIDDFLQEDEPMPCTFKTAAVGLGWLDAASAHLEDLPDGSAVDLPFWLAVGLGAHGMVAIGTPRHYRERFLTHLQADASSVDLRECSRHYFAFGRVIADGGPGFGALRDTLQAAFAGERFRDVMDRCLNSHGQDTSDFRQALTTLEERLFAAGAEATEMMLAWQARKLDRIRVSPVLSIGGTTGGAAGSGSGGAAGAGAAAAAESPPKRQRVGPP